MSAYLRAAAAVLRKDLLLEWRSRETLLSMAFFSLLAIVLFGFALQARPVDAGATAPGILWIIFTFTGVLGLLRSFSVERESACLHGLLLAPVDRSAVFAGKTAANFLYLTLVQAVTIPVFSILLRVPILPCLPQLALIACLGSLGFSAVGTLLAVPASGSRMREVLLPIILYPIWIPALIACAQLTGLALTGRPLDEGGDWLTLLVVYDLLFLGAGLLLFDHLLEE